MLNLKDAVTMFNQTQVTIILMAGMLLYTLGWLVFHCAKSKTVSSRKNRDKVINELHDTALKNTATIESFSLMVGELLKKVEGFEIRLGSFETKLEKFEHKLSEAEGYLDDELPAELGVLSKNIKKLTGALAQVSNHQKNVDNKLGDFDNNGYCQFCDRTTTELRNLRDAIFVPVEEDDEQDSDYEQ